MKSSYHFDSEKKKTEVYLKKDKIKVQATVLSQFDRPVSNEGDIYDWLDIYRPGEKPLAPCKPKAHSDEVTEKEKRKEFKLPNFSLGYSGMELYVTIAIILIIIPSFIALCIALTALPTANMIDDYEQRVEESVQKIIQQ